MMLLIIQKSQLFMYNLETKLTERNKMLSDLNKYQVVLGRSIYQVSNNPNVSQVRFLISNVTRKELVMFILQI